MDWLLFAILSYFLLAIVALIDKYLLSGPISDPKAYSFYAGVLRVVVFALIPFGLLSLPEPKLILLALAGGAVHIVALYSFFSALKKFEVSRIVPAIGAILPLITFFFVFLLEGGEMPEIAKILSFFLLILGGVLITWQKERRISLASLKISAITALLFSVYFVIAKLVYSSQDFWSGFILMMIGSFLTAFLFLFSKEARANIFKKDQAPKKKSMIVFLFNQALGGTAFIIQNWAVALAPLIFLAFVNALEATKYVFVLIFVVLLSLKFPNILKEEFSKGIILQKVLSILLIGVGLYLLAL